MEKSRGEQRQSDCALPLVLAASAPERTSDLRVRGSTPPGAPDINNLRGITNPVSRRCVQNVSIGTRQTHTHTGVIVIPPPMLGYAENFSWCFGSEELLTIRATALRRSSSPFAREFGNHSVELPFR